MMDTTTVYVLIDPRNHEVRYVGRTRNSLLIRLSEHLSNRGSKRKQEWINELKAAGLRPVIEAIESVPVNNGKTAELHWIRKYEKAGTNLTNGRFVLPVEETTTQKRIRLANEFAELLAKNEAIPRNTDGSIMFATMATRAFEIAIQVINEGFLNSDTE